MNTKIEKIQKSSNAALIVTKIIRVIAIIMAVITFVAGILFVAFRNFLNAEFAKAIGAGALDLEAELRISGLGDLITQHIGLHDLAVSLGINMLVAGITMIVLAVLMYFVGKVFKDIKEGYSPFQPAILKNMKISFVIITLLSLDSSILIGILIGFSLWCVVCVFEYGCELQRQSDETL